MQPVPVIVFNDEPYQRGNGLYKRTVCFTQLNVHVTFFYEVYNEREYINFINEAVKCDDSCQQCVGETHDFSEAHHRDKYPVKEIVAKALAYKELQSP